eukprot:CAMPEP_0171410908 /NCGR_PEP_ID=MMETSP0880-20121228/28609_1 /TAXON_ID=67004 /ORGANISM="Thalassiosira weissflogii, Strain CCMP1336" /LENGTH=90 /DNA_ID=CAMNT_0011927827 /DNA_START=8 /DNA_END=280 /DNA_ORIENTATION=-
MNGRRQSNMASASIGQAPGRARMHMYLDPNRMNPSLLPLGQNIINLISNEATNVQDHSGRVIISLQVKAMKLTFQTTNNFIPMAYVRTKF